MPYRIKAECVVCWKCMDACPLGAVEDSVIQISSRHQFTGVAISEAKCNQCGLCLEVCPMDAIEEYAEKSAESAGA